jgi:hypothetical protein
MLLCYVRMIHSNNYHLNVGWIKSILHTEQVNMKHTRQCMRSKMHCSTWNWSLNIYMHFILCGMMVSLLACNFVPVNPLR